MTSRVANVASHLAPQGKEAILKKNDDDVVIVSAVRTPLGRGLKGSFKDTTPEDLLAPVLKAVVERVGLDKGLVEDTQVGNVLPPGGGATVARMAQIVAGFPVTTSISTVNRQCASGLTAVNSIALEIASGEIDIGIGAGVESMSQNYGAVAMPSKFSEVAMDNETAADCLLPMGITSENVAEKYNVTRKDQDEFAAKSFQKAWAAQQAGKFKSEIVPVKAIVVDPKTEEEKEVLVEQDEGTRDGVTAESLAKLKPVFKADGATHAGNASQVSDGAAAVLLARRSVAQKLNLPILGKYVLGVAAGVEPNLMGIGPAFAIPKLFGRLGITVSDVDFFEINEAFASQSLMSVRTVGIPEEKLNVHGGAIAFGHPLGATGARQIATIMPIFKEKGGKIAVLSMCVGTGMGYAALIVNEQ